MKRVAIVLFGMWLGFAVGMLGPHYLRCMRREGWWNPLSKARCELEIIGLRPTPTARR